MNAVLSKPRVKASKRTPVPATAEPTAVTIADIRQWIGTAEEKLEMAYDAAERGEPIDVLLDHINHNVILEPNRIIQRDDLTQSDARRVYAGLFPVLACIQGAIKLAERTTLHATLEDVFTLLDTAQTALDPVNDAVRALPAGGAGCEFQRGRDLAISALESIAKNPSKHECYRRHRDNGADQDNCLADDIIEVMCEPAMLEGFASVLTAAVAASGTDSDYFKAVTLAETLGGAPGTDGTQAGEPSYSEVQVATPPPVRRAAHTDEAHDPYCVMLQAQAIAEIAATAAATDVYWALASLTDKCTEKAEEAQRALQNGEYSSDLHEQASNELAGLVGLLRALNSDAVDDVLLYALGTLLVVAKAQLDADYEAHRRGAQ